MPIGIIGEDNKFTPLEPSQIELEPTQEAEEPAFWETAGAAARQNNQVISYLAEEANVPTPATAVLYDRKNQDNNLGQAYISRAKEDGYTDLNQIMKFDHVRSDKQYDALKRQIAMESKDVETLSKADGFSSIGLSMLFSVADIDAVSFVPGIGQILKAGRTGKKTIDIATDAAKIGALGAASGIASEMTLQDTQVLRDEEEYKNAAIGGLVLGGLLGGGVSALSGTKFDSMDFKKDIGGIIRQGTDPNYGVSSTSAAEVKKTTLEEEGRYIPNFAAKVVNDYLKMDRLVTDNKVAQLQNSPVRVAREWVNQTATSVNKMLKNKSGIPTVKGGALEERLEISLGEMVAIEQDYLDVYHQYAYGAERGLGDVTLTEFRDFFGKTPEGKLPYHKFNEEVSKAAITENFEHPIPEVSAMARKIHDEVYAPVLKDGIELGIFPEDTKVTTAANYMSRWWNKDFIKQKPEVADEVFFQDYKRSQEENMVIQNQIAPLYDEYIAKTQNLKQDTARLKAKGKTAEKLKIQVEEGFRFLKDIRERQNVGLGALARSREKIDNLVSDIFEKEMFSDAIVKNLNKETVKKIDDINQKLEDLFFSKKQSLENFKDFKRAYNKAKRHKEFKPKVKYPVLQFLKGRIHPDGRFAAELATMDITPKKFPGYFSKNGEMDLDNIPIDESAGLAAALDKTPDTPYFDQQELLDAIDAEMRGEPIFYDDKDIVAYDKWLETQDFVQSLNKAGASTDIDPQEAFDLFQRNQEPIDDTDIGREFSDLENELEQLDFYDRASELLPSLKKDIESAAEDIKNIPNKDKAVLDRQLKELNKIFDDIEASLKKDRENLSKKRESLQKAEGKQNIKMQERRAFDKQATKRSKGRVRTLLSKIEEYRASEKDIAGLEYNIAKMREELTELSKGWQSQTGFSMAKKSDLSDDDFNKLMQTIINTEMLSDDNLRGLAKETRNIIISTPDGSLPYEKYINMDGTSSKGGGSMGARSIPNAPSSLMHRSLLIDDNILQQAGLLNMDAMAVAKRHYTQTVPFMKWYRHTDGDVELVNLRKDIEMSYEELIEAKRISQQDQLSDADKAFLDRFSPEQTKYYENKSEAQILKDRDNDFQNVLTIRDMALGTHGASVNPDSGLVRISRAMRNYNVITKMGGIVLSSMSDLAKMLMLKSPLKKGIVPVIKALSQNKSLYKMKKKELARFYGVMEMMRNAKLSQMVDIADQYKPRTSAERGIQYMTDKFGYITGMTAWNDFLKTSTAISYEDEILEMMRDMAAGKADQETIEHLAQANIDKDLSDRIINQFEKHGYKDEKTQINVLNAADWDDFEARTALGSAVLKRVNTIVQTPGWDKPAKLSSNEAFKALGQFKGFFINSTDRVLFHGLQNIHNPRQLASFVAMINIGMMIYAIKTIQAGRELSDDPATWLIEGFDRAGIFGVFMEYNNMLDKVGMGIRRVAGGEMPSRYASRSVAESIMGPNFGMFVNILSLTGALGKRELSQSDINTILGLIPGQNQPVIQQLVRNPLEEALGGNQ